MSNDDKLDGNVVNIFSGKNVETVQSESYGGREGIYKNEEDFIEKTSQIFSEDVRPEHVIGSFMVFIVKDSDGDVTPLMSSMCQGMQEYNLIGGIEMAKAAFIGCIDVRSSVEKYEDD